MPVTDATAYVHGAGSTGLGPITSTANVISAGSQAGTVLTVTTITTGQIQVGQTVSGANVLPNTVVTGYGTGSGNNRDVHRQHLVDHRSAGFHLQPKHPGRCHGELQPGTALPSWTSLGRFKYRCNLPVPAAVPITHREGLHLPRLRLLGMAAWRLGCTSS